VQAAEAHELLAGALADAGFGVVPDFLMPGASEALLAQAHQRQARGEFEPARVGHGMDRQLAPALRGDSIRWIDPDRTAAPERALLARLEALRVALNRSLFLGARSVEAHYACYPPGAIYARHVDRFRDDDARVISLVLYLNPGWRDEDGGALRIHPAEGPPRDVLPRAGQLVAMRSERVAHEVLPARRARFSVAAWLRRE
jgi:SM-20-related protein